MQRLTERSVKALAKSVVELNKYELGAAEEIAVAYSPRDIRDKLSTFFALDRRLGQIVAQTSEPMLGQLRLAWWRDVLAQEPNSRPQGDVVLDAIGTYWHDGEDCLRSLVDGWEHMLTEGALTEEEARLCTAGRTAPLIYLAGLPRSLELEQSIRGAAWRWSLADLASRTSREDEKSLLLSLGLHKIEEDLALPKQFRGLAVLGALARRSLKRGGRPIMEGRLAALLAMRVAIVGR